MSLFFIDMLMRDLDLTDTCAVPFGTVRYTPCPCAEDISSKRTEKGELQLPKLLVSQKQNLLNCSCRQAKTRGELKFAVQSH